MSTQDISTFFEIMMLVCFGLAWPFSVYRSWRSRTTAGKSVAFLWIILFGYVCGCLHKVFGHFDRVILLYAFNGLLVALDLALYFRNRRLMRAAARAAASSRPAAV